MIIHREKKMSYSIFKESRTPQISVVPWSPSEFLEVSSSPLKSLRVPWSPSSSLRFLRVRWSPRVRSFSIAPGPTLITPLPEIKPVCRQPIDLYFVLAPTQSLDDDNWCSQLPPKIPYVFSEKALGPTRNFQHVCIKKTGKRKDRPVDLKSGSELQFSGVGSISAPYQTWNRTGRSGSVRSNFLDRPVCTGFYRSFLKFFWQ